MTKLYLLFASILIVQIGFSQGNVGIGTANPSERLDVAGGSIKTQQGLIIGHYTNHDNRWLIRYNDDSYLGSGDWGLYIRDLGNDVDRMFFRYGSGSQRILLNGDVGIGTVSPEAMFEVAGSVRFSGLNPVGNVENALFLDANNNVVVRSLHNSAFNGYTSGTGIQISGNTISSTISIPSDNITGSGVNRRVTFWTGAHTLGSDGNFIYNTSGNLGIGTTNPQQRLHVDGVVNIGSDNVINSDANSVLRIAAQGTAGEHRNFIELQGVYANDAINEDGGAFIKFRTSTAAGFGPEIGGVRRSGGAGDFLIKTGGSSPIERMRVLNNGNVGIGTANPGAMLEVAGSVRFSGLGSVGDVSNALFLNASNNVVIRTLHNTAFTGYTAGTGLEILGNMINSLWDRSGSNIFPADLSWNVGLGTNTPGARLEVRTNGGGEIARFNAYNNANPSVTIETENNAPGMGVLRLKSAATNQDRVVFTANSNSYLHPDAGDLGVGAVSPRTKIDVRGGAAINIDNSTGLQSPLTVLQPDNPISGSNVVLANLAADFRNNTFNNNDGSGIKFSVGNTDAYTGTAAIVAERTGGWSSGRLHFAVNNAGSSGKTDIPIMMTINGPNGNVGINTMTPVEKLDVNGNARVTGHLRLGTVGTGTTTKKAKLTFVDGTYRQVNGTGSQPGCNFACQFTYNYVWHMGQLSIPPGASSLTVRAITYNMVGYRVDADENIGIKVLIGGNSIGWSSGSTWSLGGGGNEWYDWNFAATNLSWSYTANQTVRLLLEEENETCWLCTNHPFHFYGIEATVYYEYSNAPQDGTVYASGRIYANSTIEVGDLAEYFEVKEEVTTGDIVSLRPGTDNEYYRTTAKYDPYMIGVISENPSVVLNNPDVGPPVGLTGRVLVNLAEGLPLVKSGDFITSSPIPGKGMKASKAGTIIGIAVENQKIGDNKVMILLQPGRYFHPAMLQDDEDRSRGRTIQVSNER